MLDAPLAFAFAAGLVAAFNPCGFAMLPAYLSFYLGLESGSRLDPGAAVARAAGVAGAVTAGFTLVFAIAAVALTQLSLAVQRYAPVVTVVVGLVLVPLGVAMVLGFEPTIRLPRISRGGRQRATGTMFVFGVSYATVSLSCTLPVFLVAVAGSLDRRDMLSGLAVFAAYAAGMALVLVAVTLLLALARRSLVDRMRGLLRYVNRAAGVLLVVAGVYVAYYGYFQIRLDRGEQPARGPVGFVGGLSSWVSRQIDTVGTAQVAAILGLVIAAVALWAGIRRARARSGHGDAGPRANRAGVTIPEDVRR